MGPHPIDPARVYDIQTKARRRLFDWVRPLTQAKYIRPFPFGLGTLRDTLIEIARSEHYYVLRLLERPIPPFDDDYPIGPARQPAFADLEGVWERQAVETRAALAGVTDWNRRVTTEFQVRWRSPLIWERPDSSAVREHRRVISVTATKADIATQLLFHEVHHRAQAMAMLRLLGVAAQNLDYIEFAGQDRRARANPQAD